MTILICDDEPSLRELMRISLDTGPAYRFVEAGDGSDAIELLESTRPDLVLLDVMMPGTNGIAVLEHLRAHPDLSDTPVIVVSAFASPGDRQRAIEAGATVRPRAGRAGTRAPARRRGTSRRRCR